MFTITVKHTNQWNPRITVTLGTEKNGVIVKLFERNHIPLT